MCGVLSSPGGQNGHADNAAIGDNLLILIDERGYHGQGESINRGATHCSWADRKDHARFDLQCGLSVVVYRSCTRLALGVADIVVW